MFINKEDGKGDRSIGGQAVIEGVMMRSRSHWSMAVRRPDGSILTRCYPVNSFTKRHPKWEKPFLRGVFALVETLLIGFKALGESAEEALQEEGEHRPGGKKERGKKSGIWRSTEFLLSFLLALALFIGLFIALPTYLSPRLLGGGSNVVLLNLIEGLLRVAVFILYLIATSLLKDVRRLYQYHGAEHQVIHLYEQGLPLEPEEALLQGTDHLRCGTSLLLLILVLTVLAYSFLGKPAIWLRVLERVLLIPLVAGCAYEIMKLADRYRNSPLTRLLATPGLALQKLTTRRPLADQAEVAVEALKALLKVEGGIGRVGGRLDNGRSVR
jgi:uncharacterized protein YqhQ